MVWENVQGAGSSPLTRGKLFTGYGGLDMGGLIPAHAGKTERRGRENSDPRAHPRSRGENRLIRTGAGEMSGSSPLTRGKRPGLGGVLRRSGLIPAHAGKTMRPAATRLTPRAHPRSRGENGLQHAQVTLQEGSSPLTRGKRSAQFSYSFGWVAHPRSRGENQDLEVVLVHGEGSSPLTRGKLSGSRATAVQRGLIPAHAGKTSSTARAMSYRRGSSPLTRGKRKPAPNFLPPPPRLIPAHAGKTSPRG